MDSITLVEECPYLDISSMKKDLKRFLLNKESNVNGVVNIGYGTKVLNCNYWFNFEADKTFIAVSVSGDHLPQQILISELELHFGTRYYFICNCGRRAHKLYLPPGKTELLCRHCYHLRYELSTINRNSEHGIFMYIMNRRIKLANRRANISRIIYNGRYTKRFQRFLNLCEQAGLSKNVQDARNLMEAIKNQ